MSTVTINQGDIVKDLVEAVDIDFRDGEPTLRSRMVTIYVEDWVPTTISGEKDCGDYWVKLFFTFFKKELNDKFTFEVEILN